ncbi:MAG: hypothetical protein R3B82_16130 [Sandaracinaceae bacterium]
MDDERQDRERQSRERQSRTTHTLTEEDIHTRRHAPTIGAGREALARALRRMRRSVEIEGLSKRAPDVALAAE